MREFQDRPVTPSNVEPEPWRTADGDPPTIPPDWREATLRRLEAWIDEEERLIAEIERRIAAAYGNVALFPPRPAASPSAATSREPASPQTSPGRGRPTRSRLASANQRESA